MATMKKLFQQKNKNALKYQDDAEDEFQNELFDDIDDDQYLEMLKSGIQPEIKKKSSKIENLQKYQGQKRQKKQIEEEDYSNEIEIQTEQKLSTRKKDIKTEQKKIKRIKNLDTQLKELQEEENQILEQQKINSQEMLQTSKSLKEQFRLWKTLIEMRQQMQKSLDLSKKLPLQANGFIQSLQSSKEFLIDPIRTLLKNIDLLLNLRDNLYPIYGSEEKIVFHKKYEQLSSNSQEALYFPNQKFIDEILHLISINKDKVEEDILKWSQKTVFLNNLRRKDMMGLNVILQTPIGQTQKALQNKSKLIQKSQLKRSIFRILGENEQDLHNTTNAHIFDDTDFYLEILRDSVLNFENDDNPEMLKGATEQFILKKRAQRQEKEAKLVDRKASKSRKLRFEPHQVFSQKFNFFNRNQSIFQHRNFQMLNLKLEMILQAIFLA